ncbi:MAG: Spy/CpxP family protein refolding chaperone [Rhizobiales bacterium]|nr:Spy/CpxP family protein refolding chaperone [Rhizobacter sp.]
MKRWLKRTFVAVFGSALLIGGLTACGGHRGGWNNMSEADSAQMRERVLERAGKELKLDDAQKQRLAVLADKLREQRSALMGTTDPRAEVQALVAGPKFDRTNAQALVESKTAAVRTKSPEVITAAADFFDSLNPEQQQQVREFMNKRRGWNRRS